jgi:hypothetical protein
MPTRIQRRRTRGWRAPDGTVYVGRGTRWGNPWVVARTRTGWAVNWTKPGRPQPAWTASTSDQHAAHLMAVGLYREYLSVNPGLAQKAREELAGLDLMCWCPDSMPCHATVLLELAAKATA